MTPILRLFRSMPQAHYPMTELMLKRQLEFLVKAGEQIKKANPSLHLTPAAADRKERRKIRQQTKRQKRKEI